MRRPREAARARAQARALGALSHRVVKLPIGALVSGSLVDGSPVEKGASRRARPSTYVPFRNGLLLAAAAALAETLGCAEAWGGWCAEDAAHYPDCSPAFLRAFGRAARSGTWAGRRGKGLRIHAPLVKLSKARILGLGLRLGVDFGRTWTCYDPLRGKPCRACGACRLRERGFKAAGIADPLLEK